jgi:hypothetical protein
MVREPQLLSRLARLAAEVGVDADALAARAVETSALLQTWRKAGAVARAELMLVATNLHGYYTALETLCERVARQLDENVPTGATWHVDLLSQMQVEVPGLRPHLLAADAIADLHDLRKFRHFFRNAYVLEFDPALVRSHAERLVRVHGSVQATVSAFRQHLAQTIAALSKSP